MVDYLPSKQIAWVRIPLFAIFKHCEVTVAYWAHNPSVVGSTPAFALLCSWEYNLIGRVYALQA